MRTRFAFIVTLAMVGCHSAEKQPRQPLPMRSSVLPTPDGPSARLNPPAPPAQPTVAPTPTVSLPKPAPKPLAPEPMQPTLPVLDTVPTAILPPTQPGTTSETLPPIVENNGNLIVPSFPGK